MCHKNEAKSLVHIKRIVEICISSILSCRNILPEECFEHTVFEDMTVRLMKESRSGDTATIKKWLAGVHQALDDKALSRLFFEITNTEDELLELYIFKFTFHNGSLRVVLERNGDETPRSHYPITFSEVKVMTIDLLKSCVGIALESHPFEVPLNLRMRLEYNENAPPGYQPAGYHPSTRGNFEFIQRPQSVMLGVVDTNSHKVQAVCRSLLMNHELMHQPMRDMAEAPMYHQPTSTPLQLSTPPSQISQQLSTPPSQISQWPSRMAAKKAGMPDPQNHTDLPSSSQSTMPSTQLWNSQEVFRCTCGSSFQMLAHMKCKVCNYYVHAQCYGYLGLSLREDFTCVHCDGAAPRAVCHDWKLLGLNREDQQLRSLKRRFLGTCYYFCVDKITQDMLLMNVADIDNSQLKQQTLQALATGERRVLELQEATADPVTYTVVRTNFEMAIYEEFYALRQRDGNIKATPMEANDPRNMNPDVAQH